MWNGECCFITCGIKSQVTTRIREDGRKKNINRSNSNNNIENVYLFYVLAVAVAAVVVIVATVEESKSEKVKRIFSYCILLLHI